jgi:hypothetical protein
MSKYYDARVKNALRLAKDLKSAADRQGSGMIMSFDGELISPKSLVIDEETGNVFVRRDNCIFRVFENNPSMSEGLDMSIPRYTEYFRNRFKLYMSISW